MLTILIVVIVVALIFDMINGFHDTANAIATVVATGVLHIRAAILIAAGLNFLGALSGTAVAGTVGKDVLNPGYVSQVSVLAALLGAIIWNLITWYRGIPSSSSHALFGGLIGSAIVKSGTVAVKWAGLLKIVLFLVISPLVGFVLAMIFMVIITWVCHRSNPSKLSRPFRFLQLCSASFMAYAHGSNDAQKTMGVITMALVAAGIIHSANGKFPVPIWVMCACATAMCIGTAMGGKKIIKTMGCKIIDLKPAHGFASEMGAALTIVSATHAGLPLSTTHVITGSVMGVGAVKDAAAVKWGVTTRIVWAWILTLPLSAIVAGICYWVLRPILGN